MHGYAPIKSDQRMPSSDQSCIEVTSLEVYTRLSKLKPSKASGPDEISCWLLKEYADILAEPISRILKCSFEEESVPFQWKKANVVPIAKYNIVKEINKDLRPISLTPVLAKLAEEFVIDRELRVAITSVINDDQFGGLKKTSACSALLSMIHDWSSATDGSRACVRTVLFDFRKAFDLVDHGLLVGKLKNLQISTPTLNWIIDFLIGRQQRVKLNGNTFSDWRDVPAGVPQGSKLGPWLFLLMVNDLSVSPNFNLWKYIDDTTLSETIVRGSSSSIQDAVDGIQSWAATNHFHLHPTKSKEIRVDFRKQKEALALVQVDGNPIEVVDQVKLLGVIIRSDLKWNDHIAYVVSKASKRMYFLIQLKRAKVNERELVSFYTTCIRSVIEYACEVYHFSLPEYLCNQLERLQRRALRIIYSNVSYDEALVLANLSTLKKRRLSICEKRFHEISTDRSHKLHHLLPPVRKVGYNLRNTKTFALPRLKSERAKNTFIYACANHFG